MRVKAWSGCCSELIQHKKTSKVVGYQIGTYAIPVCVTVATGTVTLLAGASTLHYLWYTAA
ncbi:hypothetical protein E2C01_006023 [Portunus trituberculatus]|uniref:Uncharacterized protein n=1 Tax=Portunus trituberculatus TaxID=210409 RepID=A0A5B7CVZ9_PORTR|nr:hypothetical protein [Portunus trituberculatus]